MFKAHDIMTEAVICTYPDMPIYDAIRLLSRRRLTGLPVVDEDLKLVGLLSEKDVLRIMNASDDHSENTVSDYMTTKVVSFDVNDNLIDLCDSIMENNFRRVPITKDGQLMGIVSGSNLINAILKLKHQESLN
jgi:CBS domain-containing protein